MKILFKKKISGYINEFVAYGIRNGSSYSVEIHYGDRVIAYRYFNNSTKDGGYYEASDLRNITHDILTTAVAVVK